MNRYKKNLYFLVADALLSQNRLPWILLDLLAVFISFHMGTWASPFVKAGDWSTSLLTVSSAFTLSFLVCAVGMGYYSRPKISSLTFGVSRAALATLLSSVVSVGILYFFVYQEVFGRLTVIFGAVHALVVLVAIRIATCSLTRFFPCRFTIIGVSSLSREIENLCDQSGVNTHLLQYVPWKSLYPDGGQDLSVILAHRISEVVLTAQALDDPETIEFSIKALQAKVKVTDEVDFYVRNFRRIPIDDVSKTWILRQGIASRQVVMAAIKRWLDIFVSGTALVVLAPMLCIIAVLIKATSPGPAFFVQERQGRYSVPFRMYKFRTMQTNSGGRFTQKKDSRITTIGRILRPLHLDELPQLLNIFLGHMSLVGPRPEALNFARRMRQEIPLYELRYLVRPGLTGYAQLNQGYALDSVEDTKVKLSYDLYYLCYHSIWTDFILLLRTVFFLTKGAR